MTKPRQFFAVLLSGAAVAVFGAQGAIAQRQPPSPEQRIDRLEKQVNQMQRQVFPKGRPADTAGFADDPAAPQSALIRVEQRLDALERQMSDLLRQSEEHGNNLRTLSADVAKAKEDDNRRLADLEDKIAALATSAPIEPQATTPAPAPAKPKPKPPVAIPSAELADTQPALPEGDPGEDAYTAGFKLWEAGQFSQAITALRDFAKTYPKHRRLSYANNLIGRALLDKGEARAATEVLLANYRKNPGGERAGDSLYYLGQALMKLGQPSQACKAYGEFDAVYGAKARSELKKLVLEGQSRAGC